MRSRHRRIYLYLFQCTQAILPTSIAASQLATTSGVNNENMQQETRSESEQWQPFAVNEESDAPQLQPSQSMSDPPPAPPNAPTRSSADPLGNSDVKS